MLSIEFFLSQNTSKFDVGWGFAGGAYSAPTATDLLAGFKGRFVTGGESSEWREGLGEGKGGKGRNGEKRAGSVWGKLGE